MIDVDLNQSGIYAITSPSGKRYIGSAVNIRRRWWLHRYQLTRGTHHCTALQRAYVKYKAAFEWSVLALCPKEELIGEEQRQMDLAATGTLYNSCRVAGSTLGFTHTQETRKKISVLNKGKVITQETRDKLRTINRGKKLTQGHKEELSRAQTGVKLRNNTSGYVGVTKGRRSNQWRAMRQISGKLIYLGHYPTPELANEARQNFDRILRYYEDE